MSTRPPIELEPVQSFFPQASHKLVDRLLARAREAEARKAVRGLQQVLRGPTVLGGSSGQRLGRELAKAMSRRGASPRGLASTRHTAPDTGGRPFHFAHSVVTKNRPANSMSPMRAAAGAGKSGAAAHMAYIEREQALERAEAQDRSRRSSGRDHSGGGQRRRDDGSWDREIGSEPSFNSTAESASGAGQRYIENPVKLANGENVVFSFGTIGDTIEERTAFWDALEKSEAKNGRVQHRLIVELPHEAMGEARYEIVQRFCKRFRDDGVPFWAALHAPGAKNDTRNYHAHIVYSERPAKRMIDPNNGDLKWDFEVAIPYVDSQRHHKVRYQYKQNKLREYNRRDFIPGLRKTFAEIVTQVCERNNVKTASGQPVRYDARSYEGMGLDVIPMTSIRRIAADKVNKGQLTILDQDYTRKMIEAQFREAAARREPKLLALVALEAAFERLARKPALASRINRDLPRALRVAPGALLMTGTIKAKSKDLLSARRGEVQIDELARTTFETLRSIKAATRPDVVASTRKNTSSPVDAAQIVDPAAAALLHAVAIEMLEEAEGEAKTARARVRGRLEAATAAWKAVADPVVQDNYVTRMQATELDQQGPNIGSNQDRTVDQRVWRGTEAVGEKPQGAAPEPGRRDTDPEAVRATDKTSAAREAGTPQKIRLLDELRKRLTAERVRAAQASTRPEAPIGPSMPKLPRTVDLGALQPISTALTAFYRRIALEYDTPLERLEAAAAWLPSGRKLIAELRAEDSVKQAANTPPTMEDQRESIETARSVDLVAGTPTQESALNVSDPMAADRHVGNGLPSQDGSKAVPAPEAAPAQTSEVERKAMRAKKDRRAAIARRRRNGRDGRGI